MWGLGLGGFWRFRVWAFLSVINGSTKGSLYVASLMGLLGVPGFLFHVSRDYRYEEENLHGVVWFVKDLGLGL